MIANNNKLLGQGLKNEQYNIENRFLEMIDSQVIVITN